MLARLVQLGIRQSRYFGRIKTRFQLYLAATVANLTLVAAKAGLTGETRSGPRAGIAMGQVQDEAVGFLFHPANDHQGLAKVALGVARRMGQGHKHLLRPAAMLPHVVLDYGVLAAEPMLVPEPLEDPLGCVALLPGTLEVVYQDLVDDGGEGLLLSLSKG